MPKFEGIQCKILADKNINQLVSAGAGSGKTTIMIEKLANMIIDEGVSVDNLLVVTFTVLAASEMKERLIEKMKSLLLSASDNDKIRILSLIDKIKTASIDTIDGFASKTIKKYFYKLEISPNIEIISDTTRDFYLIKAMRKTIKHFEKNVEQVNLLIDLFGGNRRNLDVVEDMILSNYYNVVNLKDYEKFLTDAKNEYVDSIKSEKFVNGAICNRVELIKKKIIYSISSFEIDVQNLLKEFIVELEKFNKFISFKTNLKRLFLIQIPKFSTKQNKENVGLNEIVKDIKEFVAFKELFENNLIDEHFDCKNAKIIEYLELFIELLKNFIKNYNQLKEKNNLIDFNDLNRLMLKLLDCDDVRTALQEKYKYIFVDEFQDVNPLQDEVIAKLTNSKTKLFLVGDVKQSIYGFRGATPECFITKYKNFKTSEDLGTAYDMNVNFRSSPKVLNFVNEVFANLMTEESADISYKSDAMIEPKRNDIMDGKVKLTFVCNKQDKEFASRIYSVMEDSKNQYKTKINPQALLVLKTITELIGSDFYDAKQNKVRKMTYKDIAILVRTEKDEATINLIELLKECNIPLNLNNKLDVEASEGIKLILSILKCVTNTADDVDYLSAFMAVTDLTIDDIVQLRNKEKSLYENLKENNEKADVKQGFDFLEKIKIGSYSKTNSELIGYILNELKLKYFLLTMENGEKELKTIDEFLNKISVVEDGLGLSEFVEVVESNISKSGDFLTQDCEDSVTIQTIHKSKGLEYPVVVLYNASKLFSYLTEHDGINFDADLGFGVDYFDTSERIKYNSLTKLAINLKNREKGYKEELRLLYVAFTRAKNQLYVFGSYSQTAFKEKDFSKTSFGNMLLSCFADRIQEGVVQLKNCEIELIDEVESLSVDIADKHKEVEMFEDFVYANTDKFGIAFKNTVTGLNSQKSQDIKFSTKEWLKPDNQYIAFDDKALVGTHYHSALEKLDFDNEYLKNTDFEDVDYSKIEKAHKTIKELTQDAIKLHKEADFEMYVPYCELVDSDVEDKVLVQGVVDLIIERENDIDIVDYKFSSLKVDVLKEKYDEQLALYKKAVERAFNKPVKNTFIYSINTCELK